ncbi:TPA: fimbrial protein [Klebsiella quasipneumoniae subsp. similipneumoniae]|nr:fimbrial protein [Klebsiella quasipneumoniae subsp. similipneumoniae]
MKLKLHFFIQFFFMFIWSSQSLATCNGVTDGGNADYTGQVMIDRVYSRGELIKDLGWLPVRLTGVSPNYLYCTNSTEPYLLYYSDSYNSWQWASGFTDVLQSNNPGIGLRVQVSMETPSISPVTLTSSNPTGQAITVRNTEMHPTPSLKVQLIATGQPITNAAITFYTVFGVGFKIGNQNVGNYSPRLGDVTVIQPLSCTITGGNRSVELDSVYDTQLRTKGATGPTQKKVDIGINCNNSGGAAKTQLSFQGTQDKNDTTALASSNTNIGVRVKDANGNIIIPNQSKISVISQGNGQNGVATLNFSPVNTTGNLPSSGTYTSTATLTVEYK